MFVARRVRRTHAFRLEMSAAEAFPLFTPRGESSWVPGWEPSFLYPQSGDTEEGMVFTTAHDEELTFWNLVQRDVDRCYVKYTRVTPTSRFGIVEVECRDLGEPSQIALSAPRTQLTGAGDHRGSACSVAVTYTYTALTEPGNAFLQQFTEEHFREMIESWKGMIERSSP